MRNSRYPRKLFSLLLALLFLAFFSSCEETNPISSVDRSASPGTVSAQPNFLKLHTPKGTLNKLKTLSQLVPRASGGTLEIEHGFQTNMLYGTRAYSTKIYKINLESPSATTVAGYLSFKAEAIATHPTTGKIYYLGRIGDQLPNGLYVHQIGVWDPEDGSNTILPVSTELGQGVKLTFDADANLFGAHHHNSSNLYTIDISSGVWNVLGELSTALSGSGDMAFSPDGTLYNLDGESRRLQIIDLNTLHVQTVATVNTSNLTGLGFAKDGRAFASRRYGRIYELDLDSGSTAYAGNTYLFFLSNLSTVTGRNELAFSSITLNIPGGALEEDKDIEISMETTEISGGVALTFGPHGTVFSTPAILNIEAHGIDFGGIDPETVNIFYDNEESGAWELMPCDEVVVNVEAGTVKVINAQLPHFSRYGIAGN